MQGDLNKLNQDTILENSGRIENFPVKLSPLLLKKAQDLKIYYNDIDESFVRGSGAGGQKINKTSSCVILFHKPMKYRSTLSKTQRTKQKSTLCL